MANEYPRHITGPLTLTPVAKTAPFQSAAVDGRQMPLVMFCVKVTGATVDFKFQPVVSQNPLVDFTAANNNTTNAYQVASFIDNTGTIQNGPITISAAGTYFFELNWSLVGMFGIQLLDGVGAMQGSVTVDYQASSI